MYIYIYTPIQLSWPKTYPLPFQAAEILRSLGLRRFGVPQQLRLVVIPGIARVTRGGLAGDGGPAPCSKPCHVPLYRWVYRGSLNGFWYSPMYYKLYIYIHICIYIYVYYLYILYSPLYLSTNGGLEHCSYGFIPRPPGNMDWLINSRGASLYDIYMPCATRLPSACVYNML